MNAALVAAGVSSGPSPLWYATRATGLITTVLLTASVVLGILTTVRFATPRWPRFVTAGVHRNVSLLVLAFLGVHIVTAELDTFAPIGWLAALVPFASAYRPIWLGLGTVATDVLLAVSITSGLRPRIGHRMWRAVHWSAYACWPLAMIHGLGTGTDTRLSPTLALNLACILAVLAALWWRLATGWPAQAGLRIGSAALSVVLPVAVGGWVLTGPLQPGWARRAGTPARLVAHPLASRTTAPPRTGAPVTKAATRFPTGGFSGTFTGSVAQSQPNSDGLVAVRIGGTTTGPVPGVLDIVLDGQPDGQGGVSMTTSQVSFGPAGLPTLYRGQISGLQGAVIRAGLTSGSAAPLTLTLRVALDSGHATGNYRADPAGGGQ